MLAYELVAADGRVVRADAQSEPELFWGLRGAGGNLGAVTWVEVQAGEIGEVIFSMMSLGGNDAAALLQQWGQSIESAPRELTSNLFLSGNAAQGYAGQAMTVWAGTDADRAVQELEKLAAAGELLNHQAYRLPYSAVVQKVGAQHAGGGDPAARSGLLTHLDDRTSQAIVDLLDSGVSRFTALRATGGAAHDVPPEATAYAHRHQNFSLSALASSQQRLNEIWDQVIGPVMDGSYLSFDTDERPERLLEAFPEPTLSRLRALKRVWDPGNVFSSNFPIPPAH